MPVLDVTAAIKDWRARSPRYAKYRDYYRGRHVLRFTSPDFERKYAQQVMDLRENLCVAPVSAFTDRLSITGWGENGEAVADESIDQGLSRLANMVHRETYRCGDAYALVWPGEDGTPKARFHRADQIVPKVSEEDPDQLEWAAKIWLSAQGFGRVNVYYVDRVERWRTREQLQRLDERVPADAWPDTENGWLPYADEDGPDTIRHTFGAVPVCWWKRDADDQHGHGHSVLHDVIPLQDALNQSLANMVVVAEAYGRPFWYLLNMKQPPPVLDPATGQVKAAEPMRFNPLNQQIFAHDGPGPFGQLDPPDLTRLLVMQDGYAAKVARVVGIPSYYFSQTSGDVPSGESLRVLSGRLVAGVTDFQQSATPVWRGLMQLLGFDDAPPQWAPAMELDDTEKVAIAVDKHQQLGYALQDAIADLDEPDADGIVLRAEAGATAAAAQSVQLFDNGGTVLS